MRKSNIVLYLCVGLLAISIVLAIFLDLGIVTKTCTAISVIAAILGIVEIFQQIKRDKELHQAEFIIEINESFKSFPGANTIMSKLEQYRKGKEDVFKEDDYDLIVSYLQWCEELAYLINNNLLKIEKMDDLLSYRFFLIVNNKYVQENELIAENEFYKGIYHLHHKWENYKKGKGMIIIGEETSLSKVQCYNAIINE